VHDSHRAVVRQVILEVVSVAHPARQHCVPVGVVLIRAQPVVGVVAVHVGRRPVHDQLLHVTTSPIEVPTPGKTRLRLES
jgi:hypothetical protein